MYDLNRLLVNLNAAAMGIAIGAGAVLLVYFLKVLRGARAGILWNLDLLARAYLVFLLMFVLALALGRTQTEAALFGVVMAAFVIMGSRKRSRYIPKRVRRKAIARFEAETGERYDSRIHHLDHIVPFSRGGGQTEDNLRVVPKGKNLRKGRKLPRLRDFDD